jgi:hypothetical protein
MWLKRTGYRVELGLPNVLTAKIKDKTIVSDYAKSKTIGALMTHELPGSTRPPLLPEEGRS